MNLENVKKTSTVSSSHVNPPHLLIYNSIQSISLASFIFYACSMPFDHGRPVQRHGCMGKTNLCAPVSSLSQWSARRSMVSCTKPFIATIAAPLPPYHSTSSRHLLGFPASSADTKTSAERPQYLCDIPAFIPINRRGVDSPDSGTNEIVLLPNFHGQQHQI